jgi:Ger(x)C family germination protein
MKRYSILIVSTFCIVIYIIFDSGKGSSAVEKINIASGFAYDLIKKNTGNEYMISSTVYTFNKKDEISSHLQEGLGSTLAETRATRQTMSNKAFMLGLQKVLILSQTIATDGLNPIIDILFSNQDLNDSGWIVVSKGRAEDLLAYKVADFPTSSDYINGMIGSSKEQNFMSSNYKVMDMYVRVNSEGRNLVLPYLEIVNKDITITGMSVFKKDKMVAVVPMEEARYMNMLRENKVKGILTVQKDGTHWTSTFGETKRKVHCEKVDDKYKFTIDLQFSGKIINNTIYTDLMKHPKTVKKYTDELEEDTKKRCNQFIAKMQKEYKTDCLELGRDAAATFGRNSDTDWNEVVVNSQITVNVKVKINNFGRGQFLFEANE